MKDIESWAEYWKDSLKGYDEAREEFRKGIECPYRVDEEGVGCKFFDLHRELEGRFNNGNSLFTAVLTAKCCMYQIESNRESELAPRGLEKGCKNEDDIAPFLHFENYALFNL